MQRLDTKDLLSEKGDDARAHIARSTGQTLCEEELSETDRRAAELLARELATDAIERVRVELSEAIRHARFLPRDLAMKLAHDVDSVSCPFLEITEVFSDADWQQLILTISRSARVAVARRSSMTETVAVALAELGDPVVAETLVENSSAPMTEPVCHTLMDRFAAEVWVLDKLAERDDLMMDVAIKLTTKVSRAAQEKLVQAYDLRDFTDPVAVEAEVAALLRTVRKAPAEELLSAVQTLKNEEKLTPYLLLTALRQRRVGLLEAALSTLSERSLEHVRSILYLAISDGVEQLLKKSGIPDSMRQDFWNEIQIIRKQRP